MPHQRLRRSRRRSRANALGLSVAELEARPRTRPAPTVPAQQPLPARAFAPGCCPVATERRVTSGGTMMFLHLHHVDCPVWSPRGAGG
ncbi:hypothetical protein [Streptomyces sp. CBMA123]|uniref:hypothetical protein n=1 Tax=Streptomyces sp. CBMA123 TaxID=1896313 RepID=UPI001661AB48|nr:hypothetical protein [Streptomyces sp. CBMA123]MBD0694746.1 hypothetical protein [Streptomyces sp. CBMA123]